jgi:hypothetical protein
LRDGRKLMLGSHDSDLWTAENADQVGTWQPAKVS